MKEFPEYLERIEDEEGTRRIALLSQQPTAIKELRVDIDAGSILLERISKESAPVLFSLSHDEADALITVLQAWKEEKADHQTLERWEWETYCPCCDHWWIGNWCHFGLHTVGSKQA